MIQQRGIVDIRCCRRLNCGFSVWVRFWSVWSKWYRNTNNL